MLFNAPQQPWSHIICHLFCLIYGGCLCECICSGGGRVVVGGGGGGGSSGSGSGSSSSSSSELSLFTWETSGSDNGGTIFLRIGFKAVTVSWSIDTADGSEVVVVKPWTLTSRPVPLTRGHWQLAAESASGNRRNRENMSHHSVTLSCWNSGVTV